MSTQPDTEEAYVLDIESAVQSQAWSTWQQYRQYTDLEDLQQEGQLWLLTHPDRVKKYREHEAPKLAYWWLSRDLWEHMDKYSRNERAQRLGYEPDDEAFYGKAVLEALLPAVLDGNPIQPQGEQSEVRSTKDPAEGGTYLAMYLDVQKAWQKAKLTDKERAALRLIYGERLTQAEAAEENGVSQQSISKMVKRALDKLINVIGGQYPSDCPNECECHNPSTRP